MGLEDTLHVHYTKQEIAVRDQGAQFVMRLPMALHSFKQA